MGPDQNYLYLELKKTGREKNGKSPDLQRNTLYEMAGEKGTLSNYFWERDQILERTLLQEIRFQLKIKTNKDV